MRGDFLSIIWRMMMGNETKDQITFRLKEEELEIKKKWVETGEINCYKEVLIEDKNITVPVLREELVIEEKFIDPESFDQSIHTETTRIPLREEKVIIKKRPIDLEEVEIYKNRLQQTELVEAVLKKEILKLQTTGNVNPLEQTPT